MKLFSTLSFKKKAKKLQKNQLADLKEAIKVIAKSPKKGLPKKGLFSDTYVYTFRMNGQLTLLAYRLEKSSIIFYSVGTHENSYRDLEDQLH